MREMLNPTSAIAGMGLDKDVAPHHRRPLLRRHPRRIYRPCPPEAASGGPHRPGGGGRSHRHRYSRPYHYSEGRRGHPGCPEGQVGLPPSPRSRLVTWPGMPSWSPLRIREPFWSNLQPRCFVETAGLFCALGRPVISVPSPFVYWQKGNEVARMEYSGLPNQVAPHPLLVGGGAHPLGGEEEVKFDEKYPPHAQG